MRKILEVAAILLLSLLLLGALELGVRGVERWRTGTWQSTRMVSFYERVNASFELYRDHPFLNIAPREGASQSAYGKSATFNRLGFRSPERSVNKPPGTLRVVTSGGSTTFDLLAEDDESTWPWQLEKLLTAQAASFCAADAGVVNGPAGAVEVWNSGFPGWTSVESTIALLLRDLALEPDMVILSQGINDLQPASLKPRDVHYEQHAAYARLAQGLDLPTLAWYDRSLLLERARDAVRGPQDPWRRVAPPDVPRERALDPAAIDVFEEHTRSFIALARDRGATVVLVTQTVRVREAHRERDSSYLTGWIPGLEADAVPAALEALNDVSRRLAAESPGVVLIDAARDIDWQDRDFADAMHFSAVGSRKLAHHVADQLTAQVALDLSRCASVWSSGELTPLEESSDTIN